MKIKNKFIIVLTLIVIFNIILSINSSLKVEKYSKNVYAFSNLEINNIILIGDSRMELISNKRNNLNIPDNVNFIALSGAKIDWFSSVAIPRLFGQIKGNLNYKYSVVFNMGVNDLNSYTSPSILAANYYKIYKILSEQLPNVSFYFLSVNPIDENRIYKQLRTNKRIEEFNGYLIYKLYKEKSNNVKYCDSYNSLNFFLPDGLHYDEVTDQKIVDFVINKCVNNGFYNLKLKQMLENY